MEPIKYETVHCKFGGKDVFFKGIKIDEKIDVKRVTHSGDYDPVGYITGDRTIDFTLTEPKDQRGLYDLFKLWIATHQTFNTLIMAENLRNRELEPIVMLEGCVLIKIDRNISGKDEWKPGASGMAKRCSHINFQFDHETGVGKYVAEAITGMDTISANAKGLLNLGENVGNTVNRYLGRR